VGLIAPLPTGIMATPVISGGQNRSPLFVIGVEGRGILMLV
jgi:hypothetical protein